METDRYQFSVVVEGEAVGQLEAFLSADCPDATFGCVAGAYFADFDRIAQSFQEAVESALTTIESVVGLQVRRVEPDDLVTAAEIADRLGRSRESVRLLAAGSRGDGRFPPPISHVRVRSRIWRWTDVAAWAGRFDGYALVNAEYVAVLNAALEYRHHVARADEFIRSLVSDRGSTTAPEIPSVPARPAATEDADLVPSAPSGRYWRRRRTSR